MARKATEEWRQNISRAKREPAIVIRNLAEGLDQVARDMDATGEVDPNAIHRLSAYASGAVSGPVRLMAGFGDDDDE
jgi:hypothetical protein